MIGPQSAWCAKMQAKATDGDDAYVYYQLKELWEGREKELAEARNRAERAARRREGHDSQGHDGDAGSPSKT